MVKAADRKSQSANKQSRPEQARRVVARRATAERRLRIIEHLTAGASVARIARIENCSVRRVRQLIAETLDKREIDPPAGFVQLQIARLSDAMMVAHTRMIEGDLQALDRVVRLVGELDRYHGFSRVMSAPALLPPATAPLRIAAAPRAPLAAEREPVEAETEIMPGASA
jgi:hypothetical protein